MYRVALKVFGLATRLEKKGVMEWRRRELSVAEPVAFLFLFFNSSFNSASS